MVTPVMRKGRKGDLLKAATGKHKAGLIQSLQPIKAKVLGPHSLRAQILWSEGIGGGFQHRLEVRTP